jgi:phospholipase C
MTMKRRDALKTLGGLAGAGALAKFLPGCGGSERPVGITTYVYLMMENRSYDHAFGARSMLEGLPGDGLKATITNPNSGGTAVPIFMAPNDHDAVAATVCDPDPPHGWDASHLQFNNGLNDGFVTEHQKDHPGAIEPMKFMTRDNLPISWALADAYTTCDRWFCSVMGPTLPNRAYWHTATSFGIDNNNEVLTKFSSVPVPTIYNRLDDAGVDWAYYYGSLAVVSLLANPGPYQLDLGPSDGTGRVRRFGDAKLANGQFFKDCAAGKLPSVVYIDPSFGTNDDHPPVHPILGQELVSAVYTALAKSPQWNNIMLVITYDEHGGYYDHVPPPTTTDDTLAKFGVDGFQQMGFRVPAIVIGPYAKQGFVSSVQYDHTSALKHLQTTFGLETLNVRMDAASDLSDCIDLERLAAGNPAKPINLPIIDSVEWPTNDPACVSSGGFRTADDPISAWADANPGSFAGFDMRDEQEHVLRSIHEYVQKHQGTIEE